MIPFKLSNLGLVMILPDARAKLETYVNLAEGEVSGLGKVSKLQRGVLMIEDVFLLKQKCTSSSTILDPQSIVDFLTDLIEAGEDTASIRLWWHSHASMDVFWSFGIDEKTISGFRCPWMMSLVTNFAGDTLCRVDSFDPIQMTANDIPLRTNYDMKDEQLILLKNEMKQKVSHSVPKIVPFVNKLKRSIPQIELDYEGGSE